MSKRLVILSCAAALIAAACNNPTTATVDFGSGVQFVPFVADNLDNAGLGNAVAVDADGIPYLSYLIFPAKVKAGDIPLTRPIGAPYIATTPTATQESQTGGAVGVASISADGVWTRGAAAQVQDTPSGIYIPYGPATVDAMIGATPANTNGTDIAVDAKGGKHVVWTAPDGVWYSGSATSTFSASHVYAWPRLDQAGPVGRPSVTVDADGVPWVAFAITTSTGQEVRVATLNGSSWKTQVAASSPLCSGCPQPSQAQIGITPDGPVVVYVDGSSGTLMAATQSGSAWTVQTVHAGVTASAPSLAIDKDGVAHVAYYTDDAVYVASRSGSAWTTAKVADATPATGSGNQAETTGVAVDDASATYVTWYDSAKDAVLLAKSDDGTSFTPVDTPGTAGARFPSLDVKADGSNVYLGWYDPISQNMVLGIQGKVDGLLVAQPSPTPTAIPSSAGTCSPTGSTDLTIVALNTAFDVNCLAVTPGTKFTVSLDNQDAIAHDFSIYPSQTDLQNPLFSSLTDPNPGQTTTKYDIGALDAGTYFFQCDFHPTSMTGTFIVAKK